MIKLYDIDSYTKEFTAKVTSCEKNGDTGYRIILDQTAFFPTAGGQDCDTGVIENEKVLDVIIENEIVIHITKNPIAVGKQYHAELIGMRVFEKCNTILPSTLYRELQQKFLNAIM